MPSFSLSLDNKIAKIKQRYGVKIHYKYSHTDFFPLSWLNAPINATGQQIDLIEAERVMGHINIFLENIPKRVIRLNITDIYLFKDLSFYGKSSGFTNSNSALYIKSKGKRNGYSDDYILKSLYHSFSSILMRHYAFPEQQWSEVNKRHTYLKAQSNVRFHDDIQEVDRKLASQGFINKYATISLKKDFNTLSEFLFLKPRELRSLASQHRKIRKKLNMSIEFYKQIFGANYRFD